MIGAFSMNAFIGFFSHKMEKIFPKNIPSALRDVQVDCATVKQVFTVCPRDTCNALHDQKDGITKCTHVSFGKRCGSSLGYYTNLSHGKRRWKPYKVFQFIPPSASLKKMLSTPNFKDLLDRGRRNR